MSDLQQLRAELNRVEFEIRQQLQELANRIQPRVRAEPTEERLRRWARADASEIRGRNHTSGKVGDGRIIDQQRRTINNEWTFEDRWDDQGTQQGQEVYNPGLRAFPDQTRTAVQDDLGDWWLLPQPWIGFVARVVGSITARSGNTPGEGQVIVQRRNPDSGLIEDVLDQDAAGPDQLTAYNWCTEASGSNVTVYCVEDSFGTIWYVSECCP